MRDDFLSRDWAEQHGGFSAAVRGLIDTVSVSLERLHRQQFDAPWKPMREMRRERCG